MSDQLPHTHAMLSRCPAAEEARRLNDEVIVLRGRWANNLAEENLRSGRLARVSRELAKATVAQAASNWQHECGLNLSVAEPARPRAESLAARVRDTLRTIDDDLSIIQPQSTNLRNLVETLGCRARAARRLQNTLNDLHIKAHELGNVLGEEAYEEERFRVFQELVDFLEDLLSTTAGGRELPEAFRSTDAVVTRLVVYGERQPVAGTENIGQYATETWTNHASAHAERGGAAGPSGLSKYQPRRRISHEVLTAPLIHKPSTVGNHAAMRPDIAAPRSADDWFGPGHK